MRIRGLFAATLVAYAASAMAQTTPPAPTSESNAQRVEGAKGIPPCATYAEQSAAIGGKTASGSEKLAGQPAERSGILPSGGSSGRDQSAAPTMQDGRASYRSPLDCPLVSTHPNAPLPGTAPMPTQSTPQ